MSKLNITTGKWRVTDKTHSLKRVVVRKNGDLVDIAQVGELMNELSGKENKSNAQLIADAGNVRQKINFDLPELLRQRNKMLEFVKSIYQEWGCGDGADIPSWIVEDCENLIKETK